MKLYFSLLLLLVCNICTGQVVPDTIIQSSIYTSYYSVKYHCPIVVQYKLYQGGGNCNRSGKTFKATPITATSRDYAASGYDSGHMCNAEDFAFDCEKQKLTFSYYNCAPQTPELNRGSWKTLENITRKLSQSDSLLITCGAVITTKSAKMGKVNVPVYYWKVVQSLTTKQILVSVIYTNTKKPIIKYVPITNVHIKRGLAYTKKRSLR